MSISMSLAEGGQLQGEAPTDTKQAKHRRGNIGEQQGSHFPHKCSYGRNGTDRSAAILPEEGSCLSTAINFHFTAKANQTHLVLPKYPVVI